MNPMLSGRTLRLGAWLVRETDLLTEHCTHETRVRGGYANRWLVRHVEQRTRPAKPVLDQMSRTVFVHPLHFDMLKRQMECRDPDFRPTFLVPGVWT